MSGDKKRHIYLIAGEASGDFLGAQLMKALKEKEPDIHFSGIGGHLMQEQGLKSLFPMEELSLMGIWEIAPKLIKLLRRIKQAIGNIEKTNPDILVTIDAPDFSFRVAKGVRKRFKSTPDDCPKLVHYVAPTVWAWRPKRAMEIATFLDAQICLFDFEPPYFEDIGLKAIAVGHPMMESGIEEAAPAMIGDDSVLTLGVFLGSRRGELKRVAPVIVDALRLLKESEAKFELIVPTLPHLKEQVKELVLPLDLPCCITTQSDEKWSVFKACHAAIAVSGTVGLELAAVGVPHLIAYRASRVTAFILKRLLQTPFAHLVNIMSNREVVPELIQEECTAERIAVEITDLLMDREKRDAQREEFAVIRKRIGGEVPPSQAAAEFLLSL